MPLLVDPETTQRHHGVSGAITHDDRPNKSSASSWHGAKRRGGLLFIIIGLCTVLLPGCDDCVNIRVAPDLIFLTGRSRGLVLLTSV